jgi:hypothetical protein
MIQLGRNGPTLHSQETSSLYPKRARNDAAAPKAKNRRRVMGAKPERVHTAFYAWR